MNSAIMGAMDKETVDRKLKKAVPTEPIDPQELLERFTKYMTLIIGRAEAAENNLKRLAKIIQEKTDKNSATPQD